MYNPFNKELKDIQEDDLQILLNVSEGWYIEYKSELPKARDIAKSIASFSNSRGGLYILGIKGNKTNNCAEEILGIEANQDIIHDAVRGNVMPFPYFECYSVPLRNNKKVMIVAVDEGQETPYIHNDGKIYRRQESSSDPIPENNRFSIDELYKKSKEYQEKLKQFRTIDYGSCKGEENWSYLIGYVNTKRFNKTIITDFHEPEFANKILNFFNQKINIEENAKKLYGHILLNNITIFPESMIIRNITNMNIAYNTMTIELFKNGNMKFMLPINISKPLDFSCGEQINQYCIKNNIYESINIIKFVPLFDLATSICAIFIKYFKFLELYNCFESFEILFEGDNIWRTCLVADVDDYLDYIKKYSLPIVIKNNIIYPDKPYRIIFTKDDTKGHGFLDTIFSIMGLALSGFGMSIFEVVNLFCSESNKRLIMTAKTNGENYEVKGK